MISAGVTVVGSFGSVEGTTGSTTVPTNWWTCHLIPRTGSPRCRSGMLAFASTSSMSHADASAPTDESGAPRYSAPAVAQGLAPFHARQAGGAPSGAAPVPE